MPGVPPVPRNGGGDIRDKGVSPVQREGNLTFCIGLPWGSDGKNICPQYRRPGFDL